MRRLSKPIKEIVETLLKYEFGDRTVFKLMGYEVKPGDKFSTNEEASLDKPSSLEMPEYRISYIYGITDDKDGAVKIASIMKNHRKPEETLLSIPTLIGDAERLEEGLRRLEDALGGM